VSLPLPRPRSAPGDDDGLAICPHCWHVNVRAPRLCARCGADMALALQESGGLRRAAPVQSPVPMGARLAPWQRAAVLCFVVLLATMLTAPWFLAGGRAAVPAPAVMNE
jgi:hypothetical protein